jgi:negative regulator of flagellin synthesis FlgM
VTNKISGYNATQPLAPIESSKANAAIADPASSNASAPAAPAAAQSADQVTLTSSARSLQKIEEAVAKAPVVNAAKVASVKLSVSTGTYQIDTGRVADKLLQFERGMQQ